MKNKLVICLSSILCAASFFTACGGNNSSENTAEITSESESTVSESGNEITAPSLDLSKYKNGARVIATAVPRKAGKVEAPKVTKKLFVLNETSIWVNLDTDWKIASGGEDTDSMTNNIMSYPAVLQYKDTKNTITVVLEDGCEDQESFLAGTEESYLAVYGGEFESINITNFEQLSIDKYDSFKIVANVVIGGEKYEMTHIISNDLSGKTLSWMMLDNDGSLKELDIADNLKYPLKFNKDDIRRRGLDFDSEALYRWDNDLKKSVPIEDIPE